MQRTALVLSLGLALLLGACSSSFPAGTPTPSPTPNPSPSPAPSPSPSPSPSPTPTPTPPPALGPTASGRVLGELAGANTVRFYVPTDLSPTAPLQEVAAATALDANGNFTFSLPGSVPTLPFRPSFPDLSGAFPGGLSLTCSPSFALSDAGARGNTITTARLFQDTTLRKTLTTLSVPSPESGEPSLTYLYVYVDRTVAVTGRTTCTGALPAENSIEYRLVANFGYTLTAGWNLVKIGTTYETGSNLPATFTATSTVTAVPIGTRVEWSPVAPTN